MTTIPFVDLQAQHRALASEIHDAVTRVVTQCDFILGDDVTRFETEFARFVGAKHAIGVGTGLDALRLALESAGIGRGDEVMLPANTFIATALAVTAAGATPVPVDVDETTFNICPRCIEKSITGKTKAVIPVHLYGQPCDMDEILALARHHRLTVIEDACQAHGAQYKGRTVGTFGRAGCFSFYPAKNLGACGDGGMIVTNDDAMADQMRLRRNYGQQRKYIHIVPGSNSRLDTVQAAILRVKLKRLPQWNQLRAKAAAGYANLLAGHTGIKLPVVAPDRTHVYHLYVIRIPKRDACIPYLTQNGVQTGIHYPVPIHLHGAYASLGFKPGDFPVAERLSNEILSLPMFPEISTDQIQHVADCLGNALSSA